MENEVAGGEFVVPIAPVKASLCNALLVVGEVEKLCERWGIDLGEVIVNDTIVDILL